MKKQISVVIILSIVLSICSGGVLSLASESDIIFSDSFEEGSFLNNWEYMNEASLGFVRVTDSCSTAGNSALYIWDDKIDASVGIKSIHKEIIPGTTYTVTADIYRKSATICLFLKYYDEGKVLLASATRSRTANGSGWKNYAVSSVAPADAKFIEINIVTNIAPEGYGYYDNVKIITGEVAAGGSVVGTLPPEDEEIFIYEDFISVLDSNTIYHDGFEYGLGNWTKVTLPSDTSVDISASVRATGSNSLHIIDNSTAEYPEFMSPKLNVTEGATYKASVKSKRIHGSMAVHYKIYKSDGTLLANTSMGIQGNGNGWYNASKIVNIPAGASYLRFVIVGYTNTVGEWYLDDIELSKQMDVFNEDFENGISDWSEFINTSDMVVEVFTEENTSSLHILDNSSTQAPIILSPKINVNENVAYRISAKSKRISGSMTVNYRFYKSDDTQISNERVGIQGNGSDWYCVSKNIVAPEGASYLRFVIAGYTNTLGEWYIDDIELSKINEVYKENINSEYHAPVQGGTVDATIVTPSNDTLIYNAYNDKGDKLGDYSHAGFLNSRFELPITENLPIYSEIYPDDNSIDDTNRIQIAIDEASECANGGMQVVKLKAGKYKIGPHGLNMKSGVVLSGEGQGPTGTILYAYAPVQHTVITASGNKPMDIGTPSYVTDSYIKSGSKVIHISSEDSSKFRVGDLVGFRYPYSDEWVDAMGMGQVENFDGNFTSWYGKIQPTYERIITAINGTEVTLDFPFFIPYDQEINNEEHKAYIIKLNDAERCKNIGIENLRIESYYNGSSDDEKHALYAISFQRVEDAFVRDVTGKYFYSSIVRCIDESKRITVLNCSSLEPVSKVQGDRRYAFFAASNTQQILFVGCYSYGGRHDFATSGYCAGPIAFVDNVVDASHDSCETHSQWSVGILYDNVRLIKNDTYGLISLSNRGKWGTISSGSHGWTTAGSVSWNSLSSSILVHKPPLTYQNFAVGMYGNYYDSESVKKRNYNVSRYKSCYGVGGESYSEENFYNVEGSSLFGDSYQENQLYAVNPRSLFKAQLSERITGTIKNARPNSPTIVYPACDLQTSTKLISIEGFCDLGAEKVTIYIDNIPYDVNVDLSDSTYKLNIELAPGTHKIYASQTIDGNEGMKTADRFISTGHMSSDVNNLQSAYIPNKTTLLLNDNRKTYDEYLTESTIYRINNISGYGTETEPYIINTPEKFKAIFGAGNADETTYANGVYYNITENLEISNHAPNSMIFHGVLYADALKTINLGNIQNSDLILKNSQCAELNIESNSASVNTALFSATNGATIKNIALQGSISASDSEYHGVFAPITKLSAIENCINHIDITATGTGNNCAIGAFSGLAKDSDTIFNNCINYANVNGKNFVGGIVGTAYASVANCINYGEIVGTKNVGGIIGDSNATSIQNCKNYGDVTATVDWALAGGIVGCQRINTSISLSANYGNILCGNDTNNYTAGGIVGYITSNVYGTRKVIISECMNIGEVIAEKNTSYAGSIVGYTQGTLEVNDSFNVGRIYGGAGSGRVVGDASKLASGRTILIDSFYDASVTDVRTAIATNTSANVTISNVYGLSSNPDSGLVENELLNISTETLECLIEDNCLSNVIWEKVENNNYPYPTLINLPYFINEAYNYVMPTEIFASEQNTVICNIACDKYALIASKAPGIDGLKLKEFGVVTGDSYDLRLKNCKYVFTADYNKILQPSGSFGCLLYNTTETSNGFLVGAVYFVRPYALYEDCIGNKYEYYGTVKNFTFDTNI